MWRGIGGCRGSAEWTLAHSASPERDAAVCGGGRGGGLRSRPPYGGCLYKKKARRLAGLWVERTCCFWVSRGGRRGW
jgi:hypothetical protein